jgi:hypothetical protein
MEREIWACVHTSSGLSERTSTLREEITSLYTVRWNEEKTGFAQSQVAMQCNVSKFARRRSNIRRNSAKSKKPAFCAIAVTRIKAGGCIVSLT